LNVIYAATFVALGAIAFALFAAVPRLQRYSIHALVAPPAFGFSAIVGFVIFAFCLSRVARELQMPTVLTALIFVVFGLVGTMLALYLVNLGLRRPFE